MSIEQRKGFARLLDKMERGDVLVVTRLDRPGRDAIDVSTTVAKLGVRVHCLALGGVDLTSSAGNLTISVINAVAQFERGHQADRGRGYRTGERWSPRLAALRRRTGCSHMIFATNFSFDIRNNHRSCGTYDICEARLAHRYFEAVLGFL